MLVDGQPQQLEQIKWCITHHNAGVTLVLVFTHVLEYLWSAIFCFYARAVKPPRRGRSSIYNNNWQLPAPRPATKTMSDSYFPTDKVYERVFDPLQGGFKAQG
jgi:hypothetical protein